MKVLTLLVSLFISFSIFAQAENAKPKVVVGIVIDQMRYDYLARFYDKYSDNGFKKLLSQGYNCKNANFNYAPTYTGPGHASIYTGTTPMFHGIVANNWYVREVGNKTYCTYDSTAMTVGSTTKKVGQMSPKNLISSTIGDELRLFTNMKSRVFAVSLKDRAAILPGGHLSNGSYWFDSKTGNFVTSTYYMTELPKWVVDFNAQHKADKYLSKPWNTLLPIEQYTESAADDNPYEALLKDETKSIFPHNLPAMYSKTDYEVIKSTPFGNSITKDIALAAFKGENIGQNGFTDFMAISFSATDYIGHKMGPQSIELEDTYLRLDKDIAEIISYLESEYGKDGFIMFLTADHAAADVPQLQMDLKMNAGYFNFKKYENLLKSFVKAKFNTEGLISAIINNQIYLNHNLIQEKDIDMEDLQEDIISFTLKFDGVANAYTTEQLNGPALNNKSAVLIQNGFYIKRSGDIAILLEPQWLDDYSHTGTSHGSTYKYDTHVPLLWYGWNIKAGFTNENIEITDIAPTIAALLKMMEPNACTGKPIINITK